MQIKLSISPSHSILTLGQPVLALTLHGQAPGRVALHWCTRFAVTGMTRPGQNTHGESGNGTQVCCSGGGRLNHWANGVVRLDRPGHHSTGHLKERGGGGVRLDRPGHHSTGHLKERGGETGQTRTSQHWSPEGKRGETGQTRTSQHWSPEDRVVQKVANVPPSMVTNDLCSNQTNIGAVSRTVLRRQLRDGTERLCTFSSTTMRS